MASLPSPDIVHEAHAFRPTLPKAGWMAVAVVAVVLLDARWVALSIEGFAIHGFELGALALLVWAMARRRGPDTLPAWKTPFDGRIVAGLVMAALHAASFPAGSPAREWARQLASCAIGYYALIALARSGALRAEQLWRALAIASAALGAHAILAATVGLGQLALQSEQVDAAWGARHGLPKALAFATVACAGRAFEAGSSRTWRIVTLVGLAGSVLHAAAGGFVLGSEALSLLDEPLYFSASIVTLLLIAGVVRLAWQLRRARPAEATRWRMLALGVASLGAIGILGGTSGGEGLRVLAMLAAVLLVVAQEEVQPDERFAPAAEPVPLARAA